jgi:hypothetical protein
VLNEDIIDFFGVVDGRITYETVLGASVTIPEITAIYLTVIEDGTRDPNIIRQ